MWLPGPPGGTSARGTGWEQYTVSSETVRKYEESDMKTEKTSVMELAWILMKMEWIAGLSHF